jgi:very-short-patch-repair endonuclease
MDLSVRKQASVRAVIVDLLIPDRCLIIEADGADRSSARDLLRDDWLTERVFRILRLQNRDILANLPTCLAASAVHAPKH